MGALIQLARALGLAAGRRLPGILPTVGAGIGGVAIGESLFGGDDDKRRRRRRKALTNDDVKTALTIASAISKKAAENFILMRVRGQ